jgi:Protein kinase domain
LNSSLADHKRIVPYLAVFTVEDEEDQGASKEFNIILPLADADLQQFLYEKNFEGAWDNVVDVIKEASNLASAVKWLHEGQTISGKVLVCCHMDIKLDNVLVYLKDNPPVGWWKISDFGISSLQERKKELAAPRRPTSALLTVPTMSPAESLRIITAQIKTSVKRPAGAFSAPEVEAGEDVGPESDIFSFGCILFQVLARVAGGIPLLKKLDEKRASFENGSRNDHFCQRVGGGKALHKDVSRWLKSPDGLRGSLSDRSMIMNCKGLIGKTLEIASDARPSAAKLHDELVKIARGEGQKYYFDQHSNVVSNVPQSPTSKEKPVDGPQIRITPSQPEQETQDRMSVSTMNMPTSPPISPQPIRPLAITLQPFQPTSQPLPTPPPDIEHQDSPGTVQSGPMPAILMSRPPPRRPDHPPAPNFYNNQAPNVADFEPTSTPVPLQHTPMSFPRQRSRQDSAHTTHSSVHDVEAQRSEKGELIPFTAPQEVISTLVSSTRKKIIFIAPKEAVVYTLYSPYSRKTIFPPQNCKWQKGSLAGNFIALCSVSERHNTQVRFVAHLPYHCST